MDFLSQYGLFAVKALTLLIVFLLFLIGVLAIAKKPKRKFEINSLNEHYEDIKEQMAQQISGHKSKKTKLSRKDKQKRKKEKKAKKENDKPSLFVLDFHGDIKASEVDKLREEITAILLIAEKKDEVVLRLESPGGVVNGYGLAASQLQRIRDKNLKLCICIDKVAASGGYLMSCVADQIIAAPFAIVGSIGVVAQMPNFHRWLKNHDVDVELITAGQYKRTLTLLGENTEKGRKKFQEDIEAIHEAFKNYILQHREGIDIEKVSSGEHWLALDALPLNLVDKLQTSDEYLLEKIEGFNVYKICWPSKQPLLAKLLKPAMQMMHPWG